MISVFSPVYYRSNPFVMDAYNSLLEQTITDWEWVIILNNKGQVPDVIKNDPRVLVFETNGNEVESKSIGFLKREACAKAVGDILVELDADDILIPTCLEKVAITFKDNESLSFVYSNDCSFNEEWESLKYSEYYGWKSREFRYKNKILNEMIAFPPIPQALRRVEWSPNHVRAFRAKDYWSIGGHNSLPFGDDHDLICRFYVTFGSKSFHHIDECLYLYRRHNNNSCMLYNNHVQAQVLANYFIYIKKMANKWATDNSLRKIDLGSRINPVEDYETLDIIDADILSDLNNKWPMSDSSIGVLNASHIFEHLTDPIHTMNEAYRVLAPGGFLFIEVPSTDGRGAFQDPSHVSFWNENSFWYYTRETHARFIKPKYFGRFQASFLSTYFPDEFYKQNNIPIVRADLIALKDGYSPAGEILI